jgi:hypothetical protein
MKILSRTLRCMCAVIFGPSICAMGRCGMRRVSLKNASMSHTPVGFMAANTCSLRERQVASQHSHKLLSNDPIILHVIVRMKMAACSLAFIVWPMVFSWQRPLYRPRACYFLSPAFNCGVLDVFSDEIWPIVAHPRAAIVILLAKHNEKYK